MIKATAPFSKHVEDLTRHLLETCDKGVERSVDRHTDAVHPFEPLNNPTSGWPRGRVIELIRHRRLLVCQLVA